MALLACSRKSQKLTGICFFTAAEIGKPFPFLLGGGDEEDCVFWVFVGGVLDMI